jgi:hypothetical protein
MKPELIEIVRKLRDYEKRRDEYLYALPNDVRNFLMDNQYTNMQDMKSQELLEALFGEDIDAVYWLLYDYDSVKDDGPHITHADGTEYTFETDEDYYKYLEELEQQVEVTPAVRISDLEEETKSQGKLITRIMEDIIKTTKVYYAK